MYRYRPNAFGPNGTRNVRALQTPTYTQIKAFELFLVIRRILKLVIDFENHVLFKPVVHTNIPLVELGVATATGLVIPLAVASKYTKFGQNAIRRLDVPTFLCICALFNRVDIVVDVPTCSQCT